LTKSGPKNTYVLISKANFTCIIDGCV